MAAMPLDQHMHNFLLTLERAVGWVNIEAFQDTPSATRSQAIKLGYVEAKGANLARFYKISKAGYTALSDNAHAAMQDMIANGHVPAASNGDEPLGATVAPLSNAPLKRKGRGSPLCNVDGCTQPKHKNGKCQQHYLEAQRVYNARWQEKKRNAAVLAADEPPIAEDDTERDPVIIDDETPPRSQKHWRFSSSPCSQPITE